MTNYDIMNNYVGLWY